MTGLAHLGIPVNAGYRGTLDGDGVDWGSLVKATQDREVGDVTVRELQLGEPTANNWYGEPHNCSVR
jgi:hypothetical protein